MIHDKKTIETYTKLIKYLEQLYSRDMLSYFYLAWQYNFKQKNKTPVIAASFSNKYVKDIEKYAYPKDTYSKVTEHNFRTEELFVEFSASIENIINNNLINHKMPEKNQPPIRHYIYPVAELFINQKITSFRFGNELIISNGRLVDNLTLEIVGNNTNKDINIFKWNINLLSTPIHGECIERMIDVLKI